MVVQPDVVAVLHDTHGVVDGGDIHAQPVIAIDVLVIQAVDLMLHQGLEGLGVVVHDKVFHNGAGLVDAAVAVAVVLGAPRPAPAGREYHSPIIEKIKNRKSSTPINSPSYNMRFRLNFERVIS